MPPASACSNQLFISTCLKSKGSCSAYMYLFLHVPGLLFHYWALHRLVWTLLGQNNNSLDQLKRRRVVWRLNESTRRARCSWTSCSIQSVIMFVFILRVRTHVFNRVSSPSTDLLTVAVNLLGTSLNMHERSLSDAVVWGAFRWVSRCWSQFYLKFSYTSLALVHVFFLV